MKKAFKGLHYISIICTFLATFGVIFSVQNIIFNLIFNSTSAILVFNKFYLHQLIFIATSIIFINKYVTFNSPYKKAGKC